MTILLFIFSFHSEKKNRFLVQIPEFYNEVLNNFMKKIMLSLHS